ncbi:structural protein 3 family protein [Acinetobacter sp. SwsAc6]|uniref:phage tail tube protein n=1 Tax=Acinetobacter sp. SwsAc6 TaxID=2749439 RepID=UPI0015B92461|nr:phage tail tube protein [Acinetobacter sp. SwsAc6]NWK74159.1 structural protein 3 family protein [Acinetobacter sp. SwsAc6]
MAVVKTQGTQGFVVWDDEILRFKCVKKYGYGQDSFSKIDVTCLDADSKTYERGMRDPGEGSIEITYDDENDSHDKLIEIAESGKTLTWYIGSGHSKDAPTIDPVVGVKLPTTRAWNEFKAYINPTAPNDVEVDSVESYTFALVRNSGITRHKRTIVVGP